MLIAPGNLFWEGQLVGIEEGRDPWRGIVKQSIPLAEPSLSFKLAAGKSVSIGRAVRLSIVAWGNRGQTA